MTAHYPVLAVVFPLLAGVVSSLFPSSGPWSRRWGILAMFLCQTLGLLLFLQVLNHGTMVYHLSGWAPPLGVEFKVTLLGGFLSWLIGLVGFLAYVGGSATWVHQIGPRAPQFQALMFVLLASFQGLAISNDAFNLFIMLEVSSLSTYGLIAFGGGRAYLATFQYIVMGTIGASFYLLGVGYLYMKTGSLNIDDMAKILEALPQSPTITIGLAFMVIGVLLKMAVFPLHAWLPNAYTYAPDAASAQIAPLSTKLAVYLMFRILHDLFLGSVPARMPDLSTLMVVLASVGILAGTSLCLAQRDLKKTFACLIVAEAGYMLGGLWLVDARGTVGSLYHLVNDALATLALFLLVVAVQSAVGGRNISRLPGLFQISPLTGTALVLVGFNMIGVPPFSGFFSKATLITGAISSGHYEFVAALLLASLGNLVVFFRLFELAHFQTPSSGFQPEGNGHHKVGALALLIALLLLVLGCWNGPFMTHVLWPVVSP